MSDEHLIPFTTEELEALGYTAPMRWHLTPGLTPREKEAVQSAAKKLQQANLLAQMEVVNGLEPR